MNKIVNNIILLWSFCCPIVRLDVTTYCQYQFDDNLTIFKKYLKINLQLNLVRIMSGILVKNF